MVSQRRKVAASSMLPQRYRPTVQGQISSPFLNLTKLCEWNSTFGTRREDVSYKENEALVDRFPDDESMIRLFMKSYDESDACPPRADKVENFCFGATLEALQEQVGGLEAALLDDRGSAGGKEQARKYKGPLTARRLYQELKRPVSCARSPLFPWRPPLK